MPADYCANKMNPSVVPQIHFKHTGTHDEDEQPNNFTLIVFFFLSFVFLIIISTIETNKSSCTCFRRGFHKTRRLLNDLTTF